jgi:hypothetical protein
VHTGRGDRDPDLAGGGRRIVGLLVAQVRGRPELAQDDRVN